MAARLSCPTCQREITWSEEYPYRPFCSERCRLIDLGAWLSEQRAIPEKEPGFSGQVAHGDSTEDT
jgi:endogenous inhibitor of DNA gyrase (YacG/DUF329 family)